MINSTKERLQYFIRPDRKPRWLYLLGAFVTASAAVLCWMQTASFIRLLDRPTYDSLRMHIKESQLVQTQVAKQSKLPRPAQPITYLDLSADETARLENARNFILGDKELESRLQAHFGTSLKDVRAVIAPSWKLDNQGYCEVLGITRDGGWSEFRQARGSDTIGATTIRDKPGSSPRTIDGTPRIILNANALGEVSWTRLVIFHELLHAMNIPGYKASRWARAQTDLAYLPEYTWFIQKVGLWNTDDYFYWILTVLFGTALILNLRVNVILFMRNHRS
jgi:hypothetical protein